MIHETIEIQKKGSLKDTKMVTYILDKNEECGEEKKPCVLICPGGAYRFTSDREAELIALNMNCKGYHAAVLRYSCAPARFPTALTEVAECVKILKEHADEWEIDENKILLMGFSAGGHLAASYGVFWNEEFLAEEMGCSSEFLRPYGLILCYPVITSDPVYTHEESICNLIGDGGKELREKMALEKQVGPQVPQTFLWHTFEDDAVPFQNSLFFTEALGKAGVPVEYHLFTPGCHGLSLASKSTEKKGGNRIVKECQIWIELLWAWLDRIC